MEHSTKLSELIELVKKHKVCFSLILFFALMMFYLLGLSYYNAREKVFNEKIENVFITILLDKLQKDHGESYMYSSERKYSEDDYPDTISVIDANGIHSYPHEREKSRKNIEKDPKLRSLHSVYLYKYPLTVDSLYGTWITSLKLNRLNGMFALQLFNADKDGNITCYLAPENSSLINCKSCFDVTIGYRSEVELKGYYDLPWYNLIGIWGFIYSLIYWLLVICVFIMILKRKTKVVTTPCLFMYLQQEAVHYNMKKELVGPYSYLYLQKVKLKHSEKKDITVFAPISVGVYYLGKDAEFNSDQQKLIIDKKKILLSPQASVLLKHFLDAPNHILNNEEIKSIFWVDKFYNESRIHNAIRRLRSYLKNIPSIRIQKIKNKSYELVNIESD